jgi:hypothetical protein
VSVGKNGAERQEARGGGTVHSGAGGLGATAHYFFNSADYPNAKSGKSTILAVVLWGRFCNIDKVRAPPLIVLNYL